MTPFTQRVKTRQNHACCLVTKSCPALRPHGLQPACPSVHGLQPAGPLCPRTSRARILECVATSYSGGSFQPRGQIHLSCIGRWVLYH